MSTKNIGQRIRELRQKKGLSQVKLAKLIGCAQNTIAEWEKREGRAPGKKLLGKVAQILEVSVDDLLGLDKVEQPEIPCYGEITKEGFEWQKKEYTNIVVPQNEYTKTRFCYKLQDNVLEPIAYRGDYCIFEKSPIEDGDIVIVRFSSRNKHAEIKRWRQLDKVVMLLDINPYYVSKPYFFEFTNKKIKIEGKLVVIKRIIKTNIDLPKIKYIFT